MSRPVNHGELGAFLRARRAELDPAAAGLPGGGPRRRVQGLRREEVAMLAAISTDYYTRLEQGRIRASVPVLAELARVLRLDDDQHAYLLQLAGKDAQRRRRAARHKLAPQLQRMLDDLATTPAFAIGPLTEILGWNPLAAALFADFGTIPDKDR